MRLPIVTLILALSTATFGGVAEAQVQVQFGPSTPSMEFGAHINVFEYFADATRTLGGRFAKRHTDWAVSEFTYDRTSWKYEARTSRILVAGVRLQSPTTRVGQRPFISIGVARAGGMSFDWSPVLSSGMQTETPSGIAAFRAEIQLFLRGRSDGGPYERARFLMGIAIGIP